MLKRAALFVHVLKSVPDGRMEGADGEGSMYRLVFIGLAGVMVQPSIVPLPVNVIVLVPAVLVQLTDTLVDVDDVIDAPELTDHVGVPVTVPLTLNVAEPPGHVEPPVRLKPGPLVITEKRSLTDAHPLAS